MNVKDDARDKLYSLCEREIDGRTLRELRLILCDHSYLINSQYEEATPLEDCIEGFMWDESEERFEEGLMNGKIRV